MTDTFVNKPERPWPNPYLEVAAIVGHTTATSSRVWFRTHTAGRFQVLLFNLDHVSSESIDYTLKANTPTLQLFQDMVSFATPNTPHALQTCLLLTDEQTDTTAVADFTNLTPNTHYRYLLWNETEQQVVFGHKRSLRFKTMPDETSPISFALFSCHMPYKTTFFGRTKVSKEHMWDYLDTALKRHRDQGLSFIIAGGDQVYADGIDTLNIWHYLKKVMRREGAELLPKVPEMVSWYRDIYRGYWGFQALREVFSSCPTYMIWDDHEIADGWGSFRFKAGKSTDELNELLPNTSETSLSYEDRLELVNRMFTAAQQVYIEYQHSHNPPTQPNSLSTSGRVFDYHFSFPKGTVYVLDGRGQRDFNRATYKILGKPQLDRLTRWLDELSLEQTPYVFITSAVPMVHLSHVLLDQAESGVADFGDFTDDLRDSWEHPAHKAENKKVLSALFKAAQKGHRICILSGDVHTTAAFRLTDPETGCVIYQLTSSAITYNQPRLLGWGLGKVIPDEGKTRDNYHYKRLARFTDSSFSMICLNPIRNTLDFQFYCEQVLENPTTGEMTYNSHSIAKLELTFPTSR